MPRVKLIKPQLAGSRRERACPVCQLAGGKVYCRRCHGPRIDRGTWAYTGTLGQPESIRSYWQPPLMAIASNVARHPTIGHADA